MKWEIYPFVAMIPKGKTGQLRRMMEEIRSNRWADFEESQRRVEVSRVKTWIVNIPEGEVMIGFFESGNEHAMGELYISKEPFDVWFREQMDQIFERDKFPASYEFSSETVLEWKG